MSDEVKEVKEPEETEEQEEIEDTSEETVEEEVTEVQVQNPQETLRRKCQSECGKLVAKLDECNERVLSKSETKEICFEELVDLLHCVDHCVAHDLFKYLK